MWGTPNRVGVMTCALNEAATLPFVLEPWLAKADAVVYVDTGSTDGTWELVQDLFARDILAGALIAIRVPCPNFEIWKARQAALDVLRQKRIHFALKVDADDVFYDGGVDAILTATRKARARITHLTAMNHELYQWEAHGDEEWLEALKNDRNIFWEMSFVPQHRRAFRIDTGAYAAGNWSDEAAGGVPENIFVPGRYKERAIPGCHGAHYGWARPVQRKEGKIRIWYGQPDADPRVKTLHLGDDWRKPQRQFSAHPQSIRRMIDKVLEWRRGRVQETGRGLCHAG